MAFGCQEPLASRIRSSNLKVDELPLRARSSGKLARPFDCHFELLNSQHQAMLSRTVRSDHRLVGWVSLLFGVRAALSQSCYYPDSELATDYTWVPCGSDNTTSTCCVPSEGDVCLSNGLCSWTGHYVYRGTCTDPTWPESCPGYCTSGGSSLDSLIECRCVLHADLP